MGQSPSNYKTAAELDAYRAKQKKNAFSTGSDVAVSLPEQEGLGALASRLKKSEPLSSRSHARGSLVKAPSLRGLQKAANYRSDD